MPQNDPTTRAPASPLSTAGFIGFFGAIGHLLSVIVAGWVSPEILVAADPVLTIGAGILGARVQTAMLDSK